MNVKRISLAASLLGLISSTVIGCTKTSQNAESAIDGFQNSSNVIEIKDSRQDVKLRSVGVSLGDLGNPFFVAMGRGSEAEVKKIGGDNVKISVVSSGFDLNQQFNQIENFVAADTDVIILSAVDNRGIKAAIDKAKLAGKIVIAVDAAVDADVDATVSSNNLQAGELACQYIGDRLKGKGNVVILNSIPMDSVIQRVNGCEKALSKYPGIKILSKDQNAEGSRDGGLRVMSDLLTTFPKIDAVFATNDQSGVGADLAAQQARRKEFFIVGVDGGPDAVKAMTTKDSLFVATAAQDPAGMAQKAIRVGNDILRGEKPEISTILIPVKLVTHDNLSSYKGW
ncbi:MULTISPECIES: ABC transporter substrate-binding protein [Nostocales]|uniref:ABC transporter substrate-binding protein n=3 Tax=Nostocales TaxID=1161 RepID=A0A0C1QMV1_9CYAN|nr:ABC transporter substrate-binding protein [Tolypothrix bouteillei]KAF3889783.1 ABC transporter substrate-binding protein [Tolypothrix bouteillei VB521301]